MVCLAVAVDEPAVVHDKVLTAEFFGDGEHLAQAIEIGIPPRITEFVVEDGKIVLARLTGAAVVIGGDESAARLVQPAAHDGEIRLVRADRLPFAQFFAPVRREEVPHSAAHRDTSVAEGRLDDPGGGRFDGSRPADPLRHVLDCHERKLTARGHGTRLAPLFQAQAEPRPRRLECQAVGRDRIPLPLAAPVAEQLVKHDLMRILGAFKGGNTGEIETREGLHRDRLPRIFQFVVCFDRPAAASITQILRGDESRPVFKARDEHRVVFRFRELLRHQPQRICRVRVAKRVAGREVARKSVTREGNMHHGFVADARAERTDARQLFRIERIFTAARHEHKLRRVLDRREDADHVPEIILFFCDFYHSVLPSLRRGRGLY